MCDFMPHFFFNVADLAAQISKQVEADNLEDLCSVAPGTVVYVLDICKLRDGLGLDAGLFMDFAERRLLRLLALIDVAFGQRDGRLGFRLLLTFFAGSSAWLDGGHVPVAAQFSQPNGAGGKFSLHVLSFRSSQ